VIIILTITVIIMFLLSCGLLSYFNFCSEQNAAVKVASNLCILCVVEITFFPVSYSKLVKFSDRSSLLEINIFCRNLVYMGHRSFSFSRLCLPYQ